MLPLGIVPGIVLAQCLNFIFLLLVLSVIAFKPLMGVLDKRKERIAKGIDDARLAEERLANIEKDYQARMDAARADGYKVVTEMTQSAEKQAEAIVARADEDAAHIRAQAQEDAEANRNTALADLRSQVVALAMAATNKLVGEALDEQRQRVLVDEFFSGMKNGQVALLEEDVQAGGARAEVTSALPLSTDEQTAIQRDLTQRGAGTVEFRVDPHILGGLVLRVGDQVVDASVSGRLEALRQSLTG